MIEALLLLLVLACHFQIGENFVVNVSVAKVFTVPQRKTSANGRKKNVN